MRAINPHCNWPGGAPKQLLAAFAGGALFLLAGCTDTPQDIVAEACEEKQEAKDCACAVKVIERSGQLDRVARNITETSVKRAVEAAAQGCKAGIIKTPSE